MTLIRQQQRRGTAAQWAAANPVLAAGEIGFISDQSPAFKIGDGTTPWSGLRQSAVSLEDLTAATSAAQAAQAAAAASASAAADVSNIDVQDDVVEALVKGSGGAGPKTRAALAYDAASRVVRGMARAAYARIPTSGSYAGGPAQLRVMALGDSVADLKWRFLYEPLNRAYGGQVPGGSISSGSGGGNYSIGGLTYTLSPGVEALDNDYAAWFTGVVYRLSAGDSMTFGIGGVDALWDTAKVYYIKSPRATEGGNFKVQVGGVDESGFTNVETADATLNLGIATITRSTSAVRSFGLVGIEGDITIVGVALTDSRQSGVIYSGVARGGLSLQDATSTATGRANLRTYMADFHPDLITLECKESSSYYPAALDAVLDDVDTAAPLATFVGIGSTPLATNDADQVVQNTQLRAACLEHRKVYFDGYGPVGDYTTLNALGWAGDGVHVDDKASAFLASIMGDQLHLFAHPGLQEHRSFDSPLGRVRSRLTFGGRDGTDTDGNFYIEADTAFGLDTTMRGKRNLNFTGPNGLLMRLALGSGQDNLFPNLMRIGEGNAYLQGAGANFLRARGGAGGDVNAVHIMARAQQDFVTVPSVADVRAINPQLGETFFVDLTSATSQSIELLNGYNGANFTLVVTQDATGGRPYSIHGGYFRFGGNGASEPVHGTTAFRSDIYHFVQGRNSGRAACIAAQTNVDL